MTRLLLDTSTERSFVGLVENSQVIAAQELPFGLRSSQNFFQALEDVMCGAEKRPEDLTSIGVGAGPGSYTGIRVGVTVAKSIALAQNLPITAVSSLQAYVPEEDGAFAAAVDAKSGGLYLQLGALSKKQASWSGGPRLCSLEEAQELVRDRRVVGPNIGPVRQRLLDHNPVAELDLAEVHPSLEAFAAAVAEAENQGKVSRDGAVEILYLRKTQAEIEKGD